MKNIVRFSFVVVMFATLIMSCSKDNSSEVDKPSVKEKEEFTFDATVYPLNVLQLNILNNYIGKPKMEFIDKLKADKVAFVKNEDELEEADEDITELTFIAEAKESPFNKYEVKAHFQNVADLDKLPYTLYDGVSYFEITPLDDAGMKATSTEFKKVFDYFHVRFSALQPSKKAFQYVRKKAGNPPYFVERDDYADFLQSMDNSNIEADGLIFWINNPKPLASNSSKAKNTPKISMEYDYESKTYSIEIAFNMPSDFFKNIKR
ncbi:hypothetical protein [Capnocytophaga cynodegmi]|uniref:hypothetical protein n=1 Tax=Capnocytophaga cynodegmi TaxID=28189 RepID=UPI00385F7811